MAELDDDLETLIDGMRYEVINVFTGEAVVDGPASEVLKQRMRDRVKEVRDHG